MTKIAEVVAAVKVATTVKSVPGRKPTAAPDVEIVAATGVELDWRTATRKEGIAGLRR